MKLKNFVRLKFDYFIFINRRIDFIVFIYVDDLLIIERKKINEINKFKKILNNRFKMIDLNNCYYYLNITMIRNRKFDILYFSQQTYVDFVFKRFNIKNCNSITILMKFDFRLKIQIKSVQTIFVVVKRYQIIVESFIYFSIQIRFDIAYAIQMLIKFNLNFSNVYESIIKRIFKYLKEIKIFDIIYDKNNIFVNYIDVN